jgi:hypothetical protein
VTRAQLLAALVAFTLTVGGLAAVHLGLGIAAVGAWIAWSELSDL